ncbi:MAG TPA: hypothetical protein VFN67_04840 [Polyangiales bacterium]|nr:hypothetical protein [Polyangiales bacterium]
MRAISRNHLFLVLCALSSPGASALAQVRPAPPGQAPGEGPQGPQRKPPDAAFSACNDLVKDDVCEVELPDLNDNSRKRTIEGKCVPARDEERLICLPDHPPGPPDSPKK